MLALMYLLGFLSASAAAALLALVNRARKQNNPDPLTQSFSEILRF